ncbi:MAG: hypothetical protein WC565_02930 [Parcubacteria group bacterium]
MQIYYDPDTGLYLAGSLDIDELAGYPGAATHYLRGDGWTAISTDGTLADNSDTDIPSEKAVKTYADTKLTIPTYASYTPALTASVTNPTLGDGAFVAGRRVVIGKHVNGSATITFGTTGADPGSGNYYVSLPVTGVGTGAAIAIVGHGWLFDSSTSTSKLVECYYASVNRVVLRIDSATSPVTHANPWTWAVSDRIWLSFSYEAA